MANDTIQPEPGEPGAGGSGPGQPESVQPSPMQPTPAKPSPTQPMPTESVPAQPGPTEPVAAKPSPTQPMAAVQGETAAPGVPPPPPPPAWSPAAWQAAGPLASVTPGGAAPQWQPQGERQGLSTGGLVALVVGAALLAGLVASVGTVLTLSATGRLDQPGPANVSAPAAVLPAATPEPMATPAPMATPVPEATGPAPATPEPPGPVPGPDVPNLPNWLGGLFGGLFGGNQILDTVAQALGIPSDQLLTELQQVGPGEGLCTLAAKHNVDCDGLKKAVRDGLRSQIDGAVKSGVLSQEAADRVMTGLDAWLATGGILPPLGIGGAPGGGDQATNRPWIGVYYVELDPATAKSLNAPVDHGALVQKPAGSDQPAVQPDSPAAAAGIQEGDIIVAMDGQPIDATHSLRDLVAAHKPGDTVRLEIRRNGQPLTITVTLGTRPATAP